MHAYLDATENPAIRLAFGYSATSDRTTQVLAVRAGRVVLHRMTPAQFDAEYAESSVPHSVALRALESLARSQGCELQARRTLLWLLNAPHWRLMVVDGLIRIRAFITGRRLQTGW